MEHGGPISEVTDMALQNIQSNYDCTNCIVNCVIFILGYDSNTPKLKVQGIYTSTPADFVWLWLNWIHRPYSGVQTLPHGEVQYQPFIDTYSLSTLIFWCSQAARNSLTHSSIALRSQYYWPCFTDPDTKVWEDEEHFSLDLTARKWMQEWELRSRWLQVFFKYSKPEAGPAPEPVF